MSFQDTLQNLVNKDYDELMGFAKIAIAELYPACKVVDEDNSGVFMMTSIILSAIAADGKLTGIEKKFLMELLDLDDDKLNTLIGMYDARMADLTDNFADALPAEMKAHVVMLVASIAACDETISREETAFLAKILE